MHETNLKSKHLILSCYSAIVFVELQQRRWGRRRCKWQFGRRAAVLKRAEAGDGPAGCSGGFSGTRRWSGHAVDVGARVRTLLEVEQAQEASTAVERGWSALLLLWRCLGEGQEEQQLSGAWR